MPWSNQGGGQGGGPWQPKNQGPKDQGPWGKGPQGGNGGTPPDLEDLLRRGQERLRRAMPNGSGGLGGFGAGLLLAVGALIWALTGFYTVKPNEVGMNLVFGKFDSKTTPGLRYNWPYPVGSVVKVPVTDVNSLQIGSSSSDNRLSSRGGRDDSLMLTGDERIVDIDFTVFWQVKADAPEKFAFNLKDPRTTIQAVAEASMREVVGRNQLRQIVSGSGSRSQVEADVRTLMQRVLDGYDAGVNINNINVRNLDVPQPVIDSFRDINNAGQDATQTITQAQTYESQIIPKANGEAAQLVREAEGYRIATVDQAQGQTARFTKVLQEYQKAPDVTRERLYLETMERVFAGMDKVIVDQKNSGVVPYLPLNDLRQRPGSNAGRVQ